jgi:CBS domain-containing protein
MGLMRLTHVRPEVTPEATVADAVKVMAQAEIGAIAVKSGRKIAGVFTERDLLKRVVAAGRDPATTAVSEVMTRDVITVLDSTSVAKAAAAMRHHRMRHLVIVDAGGDYVGMLAQRHLLYDLMNDLAMKVDDLTAYVMVDGPGG